MRSAAGLAPRDPLDRVELESGGPGPRTCSPGRWRKVAEEAAALDFLTRPGHPESRKQMLMLGEWGTAGPLTLGERPEEDTLPPPCLASGQPQAATPPPMGPIAVTLGSAEGTLGAWLPARFLGHRSFHPLACVLDSPRHRCFTPAPRLGSLPALLDVSLSLFSFSLYSQV